MTAGKNLRDLPRRGSGQPDTTPRPADQPKPAESGAEGKDQDKPAESCKEPVRVGRPADAGAPISFARDDLAKPDCRQMGAICDADFANLVQAISNPRK